jgi:hypothetical protein
VGLAYENWDSAPLYAAVRFLFFGSASGAIVRSDERNSFLSLPGSAEKGTARAKSSFVSSRTSPSSFVNGFGFAIFERLPQVRLSKTDHANSIARGNETKHMKPLPQITDPDDPVLASADLTEVGSRKKIELGRLVESQPALTKIALVLSWIVRELHKLNCT